jgi:hypothetical protein
MDIPGLSTGYAIYKRNIDRTNDALKQRQQLAAELLQNCKLWSGILISVFDDAVARWSVEGPEAAEREIMKQQEDFLKLNYGSLESESPILLFLGEDERFRPFAQSCFDFHMSALSVKRMVYGSIKDKEGHDFTAFETDISVMVQLWRAEVERMLSNVNINHMRVMILKPK